VAVGTVLFGVLLIGLTVVLFKDASVGMVAKAALGVILAAFVAALALPWWAHHDAKRIERGHIREYHSSEPQP
jgi:hypothetical protein